MAVVGMLLPVQQDALPKPYTMALQRDAFKIAVAPEHGLVCRQAAVDHQLSAAVGMEIGSGGCRVIAPDIQPAAFGRAERQREAEHVVLGERLPGKDIPVLQVAVHAGDRQAERRVRQVDMETGPCRAVRHAGRRAEIIAQQHRQRLQQRAEMVFQHAVVLAAQRQVMIDSSCTAIQVRRQAKRKERRRGVPRAPVAPQQQRAQHPVFAAGFIQQVEGCQPGATGGG
ncbi:hypothetical protein CFU_2051 [Collimonas fungivorans Ter331]|uniref:Uncharacterized protein n=1 Tax=Collimonas fungivorans (strain Ter331) TaxID=1005048 RepID=G0ABS5_COLFT|nr:hypothetical protein CFU_2051 [Collimonas fungivorans Ter331]